MPRTLRDAQADRLVAQATALQETADTLINGALHLDIAELRQMIHACRRFVAEMESLLP